MGWVGSKKLSQSRPNGHSKQEMRAQLIADIKTTEIRQRVEFSSRELLLESDEIFTATDRAQIQIERELKMIKSDKYKSRHQHELNTFKQACNNYFNVKRVIYRSQRARLDLASFLLKKRSFDV